MPTYTFNLPDGRIFDVDAPAEMSRDEAQARLMAQVDMPSARSVAAESGPLGAAMIGAGKTFSDIGRGAQDLYYRATGDEAGRQRLAAEAAEEERLYAPLAAESPVATGIGEALPFVAVPGAGAGAGIGTRIATEALIGGGLGALEYDTDLLTGAAFGAGGGLLGHAAGAGLRRLQGPVDARVPPPEHTAMIRRAENLGYRLTPAQRLQSTQLDQLESAIRRTPLTSAAFTAQAQKNQDLVNRIARKAIGEAPEGQITDDVLEHAHERIGKEFDRLTPEGHTLDLANDPQFMADLARIDAEHLTSPVRTMRWPRMRRMMTDIMSEPITMPHYQRIVSDAAANARTAGANLGDTTLERTLYDFREAMDQAYLRSLGPEALDELKNARRQYAVLKAIEKPGVLVGGDLRTNALRRELKRQGKGRVRGKSDLAEAARLGHHFATSIGSSGTPEGMLLQTAMQAPQETLTTALIGNLVGNAYMRGHRALEAGGTLGHAVADTLTSGLPGPGIFGLYGTPAHLGRTAGLVYSDQ